MHEVAISSSFDVVFFVSIHFKIIFYSIWHILEKKERKNYFNFNELWGFRCKEKRFLKFILFLLKKQTNLNNLQTIPPVFVSKLLPWWLYNHSTNKTIISNYDDKNLKKLFSSLEIKFTSTTPLTTHIDNFTLFTIIANVIYE